MPKFFFTTLLLLLLPAGLQADPLACRKCLERTRDTCLRRCNLPEQSPALGKIRCLNACGASLCGRECSDEEAVRRQCGACRSEHDAACAAGCRQEEERSAFQSCRNDCLAEQCRKACPLGRKAGP